jgi:type I restriction enzyme S subunit
MSFPAYPEYKDSGVPWLGKVPAHWDVRPIKYDLYATTGGTSIKGESASEAADGLYQGFSASGPDVWLEDFQFDCDGIVLSAVGARCGKTFKASGRWGAVANTHCFFLRSAGVRDFWWYVTNREDWWEKGGTAQPFVKVADTLARKWAVPPPTEQTAIAAFLDRETAKIDALVAEQERLIALLKEKRQAVISHAVTKGLNPHAPMKDSGVPWLGEVPAHWEVLPVKAVATYNDEVLDEATEPDLEIDYIEISDVDEIAGVKAATHLTFAASPSRARRLIRSGDILVSTVRTYLRAIAPVPPALDGAVASTGFCVIRARSADGAYLSYALRSEAFVAEVIARSVGVSYPAINASDLVAIPIAMPPKVEQTAIAAFLDWETAKIDALVAEARAAITLLQERRAALISAAVTGKIDVRGLVDAPADMEAA